MSRTSPIALLRDGALGGLAYSLAIGTVHLAVGTALILLMNMPPLVWFAAKSVLIEVALGPVVGVLFCPLLLLPRGRWLHLAALALLWIAAERWVALDPDTLQMWIGPGVGGAALVAIGRALGRRRPALPIVFGVALPLAVLAAPSVRTAVKGGVAKVDRSARPMPPAGSPDVVFVVLDTVRAKSVSAYGYERDTSPNFDKLASEGVLFEDAVAPATWSLPAHASLFTGHFPSSHDAHFEHRYLDDRLPTLAGTMADAGWQTLCFTANTHLSDSFGLIRGFDWTDQAWITGAGGRGFAFIYRLLDKFGFADEDKGGAQVASNVERWMSERKPDDGPAFVFVNILEAHFPFHQLPEEFLFAFSKEDASTLSDASQVAFGAMFGRTLSGEELAFIHQPVLDMYDSGVKYSDHLLGRVIETYRKAGRLDNTIFVVLGDHGELTGEHDYHGHGAAMLEPGINVPMAIRYPARIAAGSRVAGSVSTVGTFATIMDLLGRDLPGPVHVDSLLPALEGRPAGQPVLSERFEESMLVSRYAPDVLAKMDPMLSPRGRFRIFRSGKLKLVTTTQVGTHLFDLATDPGEDHDLAEGSPERARLEEELRIFERALGLPPLDAEVAAGAVPELDASAKEQLEALGYIEGE